MRRRIALIARNSRLLAGLVMLLIVDAALLHMAGSAIAAGAWLQPAVVLALGLFVARVWYPEFVAGLQAIALVSLLAFFAVQLYGLAVAQELMGPFSPASLLVYVAVTGAPALFAVLRGSFADAVTIRAGLQSLSRFSDLALAGVLVVVADAVLLTYFNTLLWPHFWPTSAFVVLTLGFAVLLWFPEFGTSAWMLRVVGMLLIFIGQSYWLHSFEVARAHPSPLAYLHLIGITGMLLVLIINYVNQSRPRNNTVPPPLPPSLPTVAAIIPTYGEPLDVLERTVASVKKQDYPADRLYIVVSDDGRREEVRAMAARLEVGYVSGPQKDAKAGNLNAALSHIESICPEATLVLTEDADDVLEPIFLKSVVGYFEDPSIAFVQTPKEAFAPRADPFGTRDRMFYDIFQVGRNGFGAAFACGSGVLWRIAAVKSVGGFATWNVVEDLTTSYYLHAAGYRSEYHNVRMCVGLAPEDIPGLLKQRGTWAVDTWRLFLFDNPLVKRGLSPAQRLQYLELGLFYFMSAFVMPLLMLLPIISLATGHFLPINGSALFPWLAISFLYYVALSRGRSLFMLRMWQYWIGLWPAYLRAFWIAVRSRQQKPKYVVTRKTRESGVYAHLLWPQFAYLATGAVVTVHALLAMPEVDPGTKLTNIAVLLFFAYMTSGICKAAFFGVQPFVAEPMARLVRVVRGS